MAASTSFFDTRGNCCFVPPVVGWGLLTVTRLRL